MIKYSFLAALIASISTFIAIIYFKELSATTSIIGSSIAALVIIQIWGRRRKRLPTKKEKTKFILIYSLLMFIILFMPILFSASYNAAGLSIRFITLLAYPIWMLIFFNDKSLLKFVPQEIKQ